MWTAVQLSAILILGITFRTSLSQRTDEGKNASLESRWVDTTGLYNSENAMSAYKMMFQVYQFYDKVSGIGCEVEAAKMCFVQYANATVHAMLSPLGHSIHAEACRHATRYRMCIDEKTKACPKDMVAFDPLLVSHLKVLDGVSYTACMVSQDDKEKEEMDDMDKSCDVMSAGACIMNFVYVGVDMTSKSSMYTIPTACMEAKTVLQCLSNSMSGCRNSRIRGAVGNVANQIHLTAESWCMEPGCNYEVAMDTLYKVKNMLDSPVSDMKSSMSCWMITYPLDVTMTNLRNCPWEIYGSMISNTIYAVRELAKDFCANVKEMNYGRNPLMEEVITLSSIANNPYAMKENVCPMVKTAVSKLLKMKDDRIPSELVTLSLDTLFRMYGNYCMGREMMGDCTSVQSNMCDKERARTCVAHSNIEFYTHNVKMFGWDVVCQEMQKMTDCVQYMTSGCSSESMKWSEIDPKVKVLFSQVADHCPLTTMMLSKMHCYSNRTCDVHAAFSECFMPVSASDMTNNACMLVNQHIRCVSKYSNCGMLPVFESVAYASRNYLMQFQPYCVEPAAEIMTATIPKCTIKTLDAMVYITSKTTNFTQDLCLVFAYLHNQSECQIDIDSLPAPYKYGAMKQQALLERYYMKNCPKNLTGLKMTESKTVEPASCVPDYAGNCVTAYWKRLMSWPYTPMDQRRDLCHDYKMTAECVQNFTKTCSQERQQTFHDALQMVGEIHNMTCPMMRYEMIVEEKCSVESAQMCVNWLGEYLSTASAFYNNQHCVQVSKVMDCVYNNTKSCTNANTTELITSLRSIQSLVGDSCAGLKEEHCNNKSLGMVSYMVNGNLTCDKAGAQECIDLLRTALPVLKGNGADALCSASYKAAKCAYKKIHVCDKSTQDEIIRQVNTTQDQLTSICGNHPAWVPEEITCPILAAPMQCSTAVSKCFPTTDICSNVSAIQACITLHLRGCDDDMFVGVVKSLQPYVSALEQSTGNNCNFLPTLPTGYKDFNLSTIASCDLERYLMEKYLYNNSATERNLCSIFKRASECSRKDISFFSSPWKQYIEQISMAVNQQIHLRCDAQDNLDLVYMDTPKNASAYAINSTICHIEQANTCMSEYISYSLQGGSFPLADRDSICRRKSEMLSCVYNTTQMCPEAVHNKILRVLDWTNSIGRKLGICDTEKTRVCEPMKAMHCMSELSTALMAYKGAGNDAAICSGIIPVEMCVMGYSSGCDHPTRVALEHSLSDITIAAFSTCNMDMEEKRMQVLKYEAHECHVEKVKMCAIKFFESARDIFSAGDVRKRKHMCREMKELGTCVGMNSMGCDAEVKNLVASHKPLMEMVMASTCNENVVNMPNELPKESLFCVKTATQCLVDYVHISVQNSLTGFCGQVPVTLSCFKSVMTTCGDGYDLQVLKMISQGMKDVAMEMCGSKKCNPALAYACHVERTAMFQIPMTRIKESEILCNALKMTTACVSTHIMDCKPEDIPVLVEGQMSSHWIMDKICKKREQNDILEHSSSWDAEGLMSLFVLQKNPHITKEAFCPSYNTMMNNLNAAAFVLKPEEMAEALVYSYIPRRIVREFCYDEKEYEGVMVSNSSAQCNMTAMFECVNEADIYNKLNQAMFYGDSVLCGALEKMVCCVEHATGDCHDYNHTLAATQLYHDYFSMVGERCPATVVTQRAMRSCAWPKPKRCDIPAAKSKCLLPFQSQSDKNKICSDLQAVTTCVKQHTDGCTSIQSASVAFVLKKYKEWKQSDCNIAGINIDIMEKDALSDSANCFMQAQDKLYSSMMRNTNVMLAICDSMEAGNTCLSKASYLPIEVQYRLVSTKEEGKMLLDTCANMSRSLPALPAESSSCMADVAALCISSYLPHLSDLDLMPIQDRAEYCGMVLEVSMCVQNSIKSCSKERQNIMLGGLGIIQQVHMEKCPNILPVVEKKEYVCSPELANACVEYLGGYLTSARGTEKSNKEVCHHFYETAKCVHASTKNCSADVTDTLKVSLHNVKMLLGNTCPLLNAVACNSSVFNTIVGKAKCDGEAVTKCLNDFATFKDKNHGNNMSAVCGMYFHTMECVTRNSMLCLEKDVTNINTTVHVMIASMGPYCSMQANASALKNLAMESPFTTAVNTCHDQPQCSTAVSKCFPKSMDPKETCMNGDTIVKCIMDRLNGCDNTTKVLLLQEVRKGAIDIAAYYNNTCPFKDTIVSYTNNMTSLFNNNTCLAQFSRNMTALMSKGDYNMSQTCHMLSTVLPACMRKEGMVYPPLYKGMWSAAARIMEEHNCMGLYEEYTMDMMKNEEMKAVLMMMQKNMSELYDMTYKEPESCDMFTANMCFQFVASRTITLGILPVIDRQTACKDGTEEFKCVLNATRTCSSKTRGKMLSALKQVADIALSMGVCNQDESMMEEVAMPMKCNHEKALHCLGSLSNAINTHYMLPTRSAICSHLGPVEMCITQNTWSCLPEIRKSVEATYLELKTLAIGACSKSDSASKKMDSSMMKCGDENMMKSEYKMCDREAALYCITSAHAKAMKDGSKENICGMLPELRSCVRKNIMGCEKCQQENVHAMLKSLFTSVAKKCPEVMCDKCAAMECMSKLNMTHHKQNATCMDVWKTKQCVEMHSKNCGYEAHTIKEHWEALSKKVTPAGCMTNVKFTDCALKFGFAAQRILRIPIDFLPDMANAMDDMPMKDMPSSMKEQTMLLLSELMRMLSNNTKCQASKFVDLMPKSKELLCMEALHAGECMDMLAHELSHEMLPVVNNTMWAIGQAVTDACMMQPLKCYKCKGAKTNEECNKMPMHTCRGHDQMCYTKWDFSNKGHSVIHKGCAKRIPLHTHDTMCTKNQRCFYSCDKPECNRDLNHGIKDNKQCNTRKAAVCGMNLLSNILTTGEINCWSMKENLYCMKHHLETCISGGPYAMSQYVMEVLSSRAMVKCYMEPLPCRCGRCVGLTLTQNMQNPMMTDYDICHMLPQVTKTMISSAIWDDCSAMELTDAYWSMYYGRRMLGDACSTLNVGEKKYNPKCSLTTAEQCFSSVPLADIVRNTPKEATKNLCSLVDRMLVCAHMHLRECDIRDIIAKVGPKAQEVLSIVHRQCNVSYIWTKLNETTEAIKKNAQVIPDFIKDVADVKMNVNQEAMEKLQGVLSIANDPADPVCKPSVAIHQCFGFFEMTSNICWAANQTHECIELLTSGCLTIQKAPVLYILYQYLSGDANYCGFPTQQTPEMIELSRTDPNYNLSACASNYSYALHKVMMSPTKKNHMEVCTSAVILDRCVYSTDFPSYVRPSLTNMAELTQALMQVSCAGIEYDMSNMTCDKGDILCHIAKNMSMMRAAATTEMPISNEPSTCNIDVAASCVSSYSMRLMTAYFAPRNEWDDICWERSIMAECVKNHTSTCTYLRKNQFKMTTEWFMNVTAPVCDQMIEVSLPTCNVAESCLKTMLGYVIEPKTYEDIDLFCWGVKKTVDCVKHHAFNCSATVFPDIIESLQILGNASHELCPGMAQYVCPLTAMKPKESGAQCKMANMQMCVSTYYNETYDKKLTDSEYCRKLDNAVACIEGNSSNCHPAVLDEMMDIMAPGVYHANVNCSILGRKVREATSCPVEGRCPMQQIQLAVYGKVVEIQSSNGDCSPLFDYVSTLQSNITHCNSFERYVINFGNDRLARSLRGTDTRGSCYGFRSITLGGQPDIAFDNYTQCATKLGTDLLKAMESPVYGFYDLCEAAAAYNSCLSMEFKDTRSPGEMMLRALMNNTYSSIEDFLTKQCAMINKTSLAKAASPATNVKSSTCQPELAVGSAVTWSLQIMNIGLMKGQNIMTTCSAGSTVAEFVMNNTATCSEGLKNRVRTLMSYTYQMAISTKLCPENIREQMYSDMVKKFYMMINGNEKASVMKNLVMDFVKSKKSMEWDMMSEDDMKMRDGDGKDMMEREKDEDDGMEMKDRKMDEEDKDRKMDEKDKMDMKDSKKDMDDDKMDMMDDKYREMDMKEKMKMKERMGMMMNDSHWMCIPRKAARCMKELSMGIAMTEAYIENKYCSTMDKVKECVMEHTMFCSPTTQMMAHMSLHKLQFIARSICDVIAKDFQPHMKRNITMDKTKDDKTEEDKPMTNKTMGNIMKEYNMTTDSMRNNNMTDNNMEKEDMAMEFDREKMEAKLSMKIGEFMGGEVKSLSDMRLTNKDDIVDAIMMTHSVGSEDAPCVDPMKLKPYATCHPEAALHCLSSVDKELLNPFTTIERICMKHSVAVRCFITTSHGCDKLTSETLKMKFELMMYKVSNRCEIHVKSPCHNKSSECKAWETEECLTELHMAVRYGRYFLPGSTMQMCYAAHKAHDCVEKKIKHCSPEVQYHVMEKLRPASQLMTGICDGMPAMGCATSFIWKAASLVLLTGEISKAGAQYQSMWYMKYMQEMNMDHNMSMPKNTSSMMTMEDVLKNMSSSFKGDKDMKSKEMMENMEWLAQITRTSCDKGMDRDHKMMPMDMILMGVSGIIKYAFMEMGMTKWDSSFKGMVETSIRADEDNNMMKVIYETTKKTLEDYGIKKNDSDLMPLVVKHTVEMADSTKMLEFFFSKSAKAAIDAVLNQGMKEKKESKEEKEKDDEDEEEMMEWIKKEIAMEIKKAMPKNMTAPISLEDGMKYVKMSVDGYKMRKLSVCYELWEAYDCLEKKFHLVPLESRPLVNATITAMMKIGTHLCTPAKCFSCKGAYSNEECNNQMPQTCEDSQGCYTEVRNGKIEKGCAYMFEGSKEDGHMVEYCSGSYCNKPMMSTHKDNMYTCNIHKATSCLFDFVPSLLTSQFPDMRQSYKTSMCMTHHTASCMSEEGRYLNHVGKMIRHSVLEGTCTGADRSQYECGLRDLFAISQAIHNPMTTRVTICSMLSETVSLMTRSLVNGSCGEYEIIESYKGLQSILDLIGDDYCPGIFKKDNALCDAILMGQVNASNTMCDAKAREECVDDEALAVKLKYMEYATGRDMDIFCREVYDSMLCMMKKSATCPEAERIAISKNVTVKYGYLNHICPWLRITHELCTPVEIQPRKCEIGLAQACLTPLDGVDFCSIEKSTFDSIDQCMQRHVSGCNAAQMAPLYYTGQMMSAIMSMNCSTFSRKMGVNLMNTTFTAIDLVFKETLNYGTGLMDASFRSDMPMSKMLEVMMYTKVMTTSQEWNSTKLYEGMSELQKNVTGQEMYYIKNHLALDDKGGLAKCMLHLASHTTRALMYPKWFNMIMCEAMTTTQICLGALNLLPVSQMDVWLTMEKIEMERENMCQDYMENVMMVGQAMMNGSAALMNTINKDQAKIKSIIHHMMNGTLNTTAVQSQDLMLVVKPMIDMFLDDTDKNHECNVIEIASTLTYHAIRVTSKYFNPKSELPAICIGLQSMKDSLIPSMAKCSNTSKEVYHGVMGWIYNQTKGVCDSPMMNLTRETTCQADASLMCLQYILPYLSSQSTPKDKLCRNLQMTTYCVQIHTQACTANQMANVTRTMAYINSVVGDSCPYLTAAAKCPMPNVVVSSKCNTTKALMCTSVLGISADGKVDAAVCSKLPEMLDCVKKHLSNCNAMEIAESMSYGEVLLAKVNKVCSEESMAKMLFSNMQCQQPAVCSITDAYKCYQPLANRDSCSGDEATKAISCAATHLRGCNLFQIQIFNNTMGLGRSLAPKCAAYTIDQTVVPSEDAVDNAGLNHCTENFRHNLSEALKDPGRAYARFCMAFMEADSCIMYGMNKDEQMFLRHLLGSSYNVTASMVETLCTNATIKASVMEDPQKPAKEPPTCAVDVAAECLATYALPTIMASTMTLKDKQYYCDDDEKNPSDYMRMVQCVYAATVGCSEQTVAPFHGLGSMLHAIRKFSGVCAKELWTCSPSDAMHCGVEMGEKLKERLANMTHTHLPNGSIVMDYKIHPICQWADESMYCVRQNTLGCDKSVLAAVAQTTEESYCLASDLLSGCPGMKMTSDPEGAPSCHDKMKTGNETCDLEMAFSCAQHLQGELMSPYLDCGTMHKSYTSAMQCFERNTANCPAASHMVIAGVWHYIRNTVRGSCPQLLQYGCHESDHCQLDEADQCLADLTKYLTSDKLQNDHICMAFDMTEACVMDRSEKCSFFGKANMKEKIAFSKLIMTITHKLDCTESIELCLHRFLYSAISVVHAEVVMASMIKQKEMMGNKVMTYVMTANNSMMGKDDMMKAMMGNNSMMGKDAQDMMAMDEDSVMMIKSKVFDEITNLFAKATKNDTSSVGLVAMTYKMLHTMTSEMRDYNEGHFKVKAMMCRSVQEAWSCAKDQLMKSGYDADHVNFINVTLTHMYSVLSGICRSQSSCTMLAASEKCHILPASMTAMTQVGLLLMNKTLLCSGLPQTIVNISRMTEGCDQDTLRQFASITALLTDTRDTMCRATTRCQETTARQCIESFRKLSTSTSKCSEFDKLLSCVNSNTRYCNRTVMQTYISEAMSLQPSCEAFPVFSISGVRSPVRLMEGSSPKIIEVAITDAMSKSCPSGKTCEVKMKVQIQNDVKNMPSCPETSEYLAQVLVPAAADKSCGYTFNKDNWEKPMFVPLVARSDLLYDNTQDANVTIIAEKYVDNVMTSSRTILDYQVVVSDTDKPASCGSMGYGNVITFDGMAMKNKYRGEFVLYKHQTLPYEVHIINEACQENHLKTCTCAAMVKSVDDVFVVDYCTNSKSELRKSLYVNGVLTPGTKMYREDDGNLLNILLPTGTKITIGITKKVLTSVSIIPSSLDWMNTEGLCGLYDSVKYNDMMLPITHSVTSFRKDFIKSWRVRGGSSLYRGAPIDFAFHLPKFCTCPVPGGVVTDTCAEMLISRTCDYIIGADITGEMEQLALRTKLSNSRQKRQTVDPLYELGIDDTFEPEELTWPTASQITEAQAEAACKAALVDSEMAKMCAPYTGTTFMEALLETCKNNIQAADDLSATTEASMNAQCTVQVSMNIPAQEGNATLKQQATTIMSQMCPNDCSNQGLCQNGECSCISGYLGADCSISSATPPTLTSLENNGECYLVNGQTTPCTSIFINGENFAQNGKMRCHFQSVVISSNAAPQPTGSSVHNEAEFLTSTLLMCKIPAAMTTAMTLRALHVSISYDDKQPSAAALFLAYKPTCYTCNMTAGMCVTDKCIFGGSCYARGELNPANDCQYCDPSLSSDGWSTSYAARCQGGVQTTTTKDCPTVVTTPCPRAPTCAPNGNSGQVGANTTLKPDPDENALPIALGVATAIFLISTLVLTVKVCKLEKRMKSRRLLDDTRPSSNASSIEEPIKSFSNVIYEDKDPKILVDPQTAYNHGTVPTRAETRADGGGPTVLNDIETKP